MSIIKAVQDYLANFDGMSLIPIKEVLTDYTPAEAGTFALAPSGNSVTKRDVLGNKIYSNSYIFFARECAENEVDRADMYDFLESFTDWLEEQAENDNYPTLPGKYSVENLEVSNYGLFNIEETGLAVYQVQITITIRR